MYGFNVLGLNPHAHSNHPSKVDLSNIYTKEEVDMLLAGYTPGEGGVSLKNYLTTAQADLKYQVKGNYALKSEIPTDYVKSSDISGFVKMSEVEAKGYLTKLSLTGYAKISDIPSVDGFITSKDLPDYTGVYQPIGNYLTEKPTYTAEEVGALPKDTAIPTKIEDLEGSSDLVKSSDIADWAKTGNNSTVVLEATTESGETITFTLIGTQNV